MQLETVSKIKGWCALLCFAVFLWGPLSGRPGAPTPEISAIGMVSLLVGVLLGISWLWQRKRMRYIAYQAKLSQKG